jgi:hypothetical protein
MNRREKILAICIGSVVGLIILYGLGYKLFIGPARDLDHQAAALRERNAELASENERYGRYVRQWRDIRDRTYHDNLLRATVLLKARVDQLVRDAGLGQIPVRPITGRASKNNYEEIGCTIQGRASLERLTHLLFLLTRDGHLHRLSNLTISQPQSGQREVPFALRYSTLVLHPKLPKTVKVPPRPAGPTTKEAKPDLNSPERAKYDVIARRHIFLPYVQLVRAPELPPRPPEPAPPEPVPPEPVGPRHDQLVVTGLPAFGMKREVHVAMPGQDIEKPLKVGDRLPVGQIAMVDYRLLPMPGKPKIMSTGRVILKIGRNYWAVELGQTLGERRILRAKDLPDQLKPKPQSKTPTTRPTAKTPPAGKAAAELPAKAKQT